MVIFPAAAKFARPALHKNDLIRTRLIDHINDGKDKSLTVLTAAEGCGKTTLLSHWVHQEKMPVAWLRLDQLDNDPANFMRNFVVALQQISPMLGKGLFSSLQSANKPSMEAILQQLTNDMLLFANPFGLVLQHYDQISSQPVHNIISYLIEHMPGPVQTVIAATADPGFDLSRLRSAEQVKEIRAPYLSFSTDETGAFLNQVLQLEMAYGDITAIVQRANGNVAAVAAAGFALRHTAARVEWTREYEQSQGDALKMPLSDLSGKLSPEAKHWLAGMSHLPVFSLPLAEEFAGTVPLEVEKLAEEGFWVRWLDSGNDLYHIPRPVVHYLGSGHDRRNSSDVFRLAAEYYRKDDQKEVAIVYAIAAEENDIAGQMIESIAQDYLANGGLMTIRRWLMQLPAETISSRPMLNICRAWVMILSGETKELEMALQAAEQTSYLADDESAIHEHILAIRQYVEEQRN